MDSSDGPCRAVLTGGGAFFVLAPEGLGAAGSLPPAQVDGCGQRLQFPPVICQRASFGGATSVEQLRQSSKTDISRFGVKPEVINYLILRLQVFEICPLDVS